MSLKGKKIALFIDEMFEDLEYWYPLLRLKEEEADVVSIGHKVGTFTGKHGLPGRSDKTVDDVKPADFDALVIPGGYSPDMMRRNPAMVTASFMNKSRSFSCPINWTSNSSGSSNLRAAILPMGGSSTL